MLIRISIMGGQRIRISIMGGLLDPDQHYGRTLGSGSALWEDSWIRNRMKDVDTKLGGKNIQNTVTCCTKKVVKQNATPKPKQINYFLLD